MFYFVYFKNILDYLFEIDIYGGYKAIILFNECLFLKGNGFLYPGIWGVYKAIIILFNECLCLNGNGFLYSVYDLYV